MGAGMTYGRVIKDLMESRLAEVHTAFIGEVIRFERERMRADIRPLGLKGFAGEKGTEIEILTNLPVLRQAACYWEEEKDKPALRWMKPRDICFCVCGERDISRAVAGVDEAAALTHHSLGDGVVVGVIG